MARRANHVVAIAATFRAGVAIEAQRDDEGGTVRVLVWGMTWTRLSEWAATGAVDKVPPRIAQHLPQQVNRNMVLSPGFESSYVVS